MAQSTIDKIRDTTVWRTIRKMAGVIDDQNTTVANMQQQLDDFDLDGVKTEVNNLAANDAVQDGDIRVIKSDVTVLKSSVSTIGVEVNELETTTTDHERRIDNAETDILNLRDEDKKLTNALPKTYTLYRNGEGKIQAQVETIDGTLFNSNILDMIIPYQYDIISGTTERSFKLDITMSDGSKYTTNDFIIPAGGGTEVVVTGITLAKDSSNINRFHVGINLSDGTMIDSGFISMVDNVVADFTDSKLTISVNGVSSVPVAIDVSGEFTAGTGITITSGTIAIDDTVVALKSDIADMETKTNASATYATKTALASTDANVALAQSTADDANTKANSCFDNVTIADNVLTFTKPDDSHVDISIEPTILDFAKSFYLPVTVTRGSSSSEIAYCYGNELQVVNGFIFNKAARIFTPLNRRVTTGTVMTFDETTKNLIVTKLLSEFNLTDYANGEYRFNFLFSNAPMHYSGSSVFYGNGEITLTDGEITAVSIPNMALTNFSYNPSNFYFALIGLYTLSKEIIN